MERNSAANNLNIRHLFTICSYFFIPRWDASLPSSSWVKLFTQRWSDRVPSLKLSSVPDEVFMTTYYFIEICIIGFFSSNAELLPVY